MQPRGHTSAADEAGPLDGETHARVLDHQSSGLIQAITEKGMHLIRMRASVDGASHAAGTLIELETVNVLGTIRHATFLHLLNPVCMKWSKASFPTTLRFVFRSTIVQET